MHIDRERSEKISATTLFVIEIALTGELSKREKILLFNAARRCEVTSMLEGNLTFAHRLV